MHDNTFIRLYIVNFNVKSNVDTVKTSLITCYSRIIIDNYDDQLILFPLYRSLSLSFSLPNSI